MDIVEIDQHNIPDDEDGKCLFCDGIFQKIKRESFGFGA